MKPRYALLLLFITSFLTLRAGVQIQRFGEQENFLQTKMSCAIQDHLGYIWVSTWDGLCRYDGYRFKTYKAYPGDNSPLTTNRIGFIKELPDGNIKCYANDKQFYLFDRKQECFRKTTGDTLETHQYYHPSQAVIDKIAQIPQFKDIWFRVLLIDRQQGYWVYTHQGLCRIFFNKESLQPRKTSTQAEEEVCCIYRDDNQRIWIADKNGYLRLEDLRGNLVGYMTPQGQVSRNAVAFGANVYSIFKDHNGVLWLGTKPQGLFRLTPFGLGFQVKHYTYSAKDPYSISSNNVYSIVEDSRHRLWIGTYKGGLNMLDLNASQERFVNKNNLLKGFPSDENSNCIHRLFIAQKNVLLIATNNGLFSCSLEKQPQQMTFFCNRRRADDATSLSSNLMMDIQSLKDGTLMVATNSGGICRIVSKNLLSDKIAFQPYLSDKGLPSDVCIAMATLSDGSLFIVSETSVSCFNPATETFTNYVRGTFGDDFTFLEAKPLVFPDGRVMFGSTSGVMDFHMKDIQRSTFIPPLVLECEKEIRLDADNPNVTITFSALDYNRNVPITYAYRFAEGDSTWIYTKDNSITLQNLPAGTYELHIRSTNGDGVWVDNEQVVTIYRPARFHETPYAWMLYGLILAFVMLGFYRVVSYIHRLENEIKHIRLTSNERIQVLTERIKEQLSIGETIEKITNTEKIEDDEDQRFADKVKSYLQENLSNSDLSVNDFASEMAMSRTVLYARMKSVFGTTPNNYLTNMRIDEAKRQLLKPNAYITDIAYRCGFSDPKYFSRCFKKVVGMSPSDYQKNV